MGGLLDYTVSFLGQVIAISISRPRSLTIVDNEQFHVVDEMSSLSYGMSSRLYGE